MTQLTLDSAQGERLKQDGQEAIEETDKGFVEIMRETAKRLSLRDGSVTADDLRMWAVGRGIYPKHPNSWGSVMKGKGWVTIGYQKSALPSNHSRLIGIWKWEG